MSNTLNTFGATRWEPELEQELQRHYGTEVTTLLRNMPEVEKD